MNDCLRQNPAYRSAPASFRTQLTSFPRRRESMDFRTHSPRRLVHRSRKPDPIGRFSVARGCVSTAAQDRARMANQGAVQTTRCSAGRQDVAPRQSASRLLRFASVLRMARRNSLIYEAFMIGKKLPAIDDGDVRAHCPSRKSATISCGRLTSGCPQSYRLGCGAETPEGLLICDLYGVKWSVVE